MILFQVALTPHKERAGRGNSRGRTTRQYARQVGRWTASVGLDRLKFGTHSPRRTKATPIYRPAICVRRDSPLSR
jgi:hypothetical protein